MFRERWPILIERRVKGGTLQQVLLKLLIREYFENLNSNKLENLKETDKSLDTQDFPKWSPRTITKYTKYICLEINIVTKKGPAERSPVPGAGAARSPGPLKKHPSVPQATDRNGNASKLTQSYPEAQSLECLAASSGVWGWGSCGIWWKRHMGGLNWWTTARAAWPCQDTGLRILELQETCALELPLRTRTCPLQERSEANAVSLTKLNNGVLASYQQELNSAFFRVIWNQ